MFGGKSSHLGSNQLRMGEAASVAVMRRQELIELGTWHQEAAAADL